MSRHQLPIASVSARRFEDDDRCRFRPSIRSGMRVVARLTNRCTLLCSHCLASAAGNVRSRDLPLEDWQRIFEELPTVGAHKVLLTGGEPLLFEGLVELTAFVAGLGISTDLNSTLWFMTPKLAAALRDAGLTEASVALEGPPEIHDAMHNRKGAHGRLCAGIRMLQDVGLVVDGSMCVTPANLPYVGETLEAAVELGLSSFTVSRMMPVGHGLRYVGPTVPEESLAALHESLAAARSGAYGIGVRCVGLLGAPRQADCGQGSSLIGIRADGELVPCVLSRDHCSVPRPREIGLARSLAALRERLEGLRPALCYGGASS